MSEFDVDDEAPEEQGQDEPIPPPPPPPPDIPEHVPDDWLDPKPTDPAGR